MMLNSVNDVHVGITVNNQIFAAMYSIMCSTGSCYVMILPRHLSSSTVEIEIVLN